MPALMQPKTVNVASLPAQRKAPLPKPAAQVAVAKKPGNSFLDYLRMAFAAPAA